MVVEATLEYVSRVVEGEVTREADICVCVVDLDVMVLSESIADDSFGDFYRCL